MKILTSLFVMAVLAAGHAWAQQAKSGAPAGSLNSAQMQHGTPSTQDFVTRIEGANTYEIQASKAAAAQAKNAKVRQLAQRLINDGMAAGKELAVAVKHDADTALPSNASMPAALDLDIDQLKSANGGEFDREYLQQMVKEQQICAPMFAAYAKNGPDKTIKAFASKTAPVIESDLQAAQALEKQVGAGG